MIKFMGMQMTSWYKTMTWLNYINQSLASKNGVREIKCQWITRNVEFFL